MKRFISLIYMYNGSVSSTMDSLEGLLSNGVGLDLYNAETAKGGEVATG